MRFSTVGIAMPLFLFIVPHISPRPPRRRRGRFIVPVPTNTPKMALHIPTVDIAILLFYLLYPTFRHVHSVGVGADLSCPFPRIPPKMALHICIVGVAIHIISTHQNHLVRLKNGRDESAPTPYGMFAAIHLRNKWILRNVRCHIFALPISLFLFIVPHISPRPFRRRRGRFIVPVPTKTHKMALRIPTVDIAIHYTVPTKFHQMVLQFISFRHIKTIWFGL